MSDYHWAVDKGKIVTSDYDRSMSLDKDKVEAELESAFSNLFEGVTIKPVNEEYKEVYEVTIPRQDKMEIVYVCAKGTTPGGRSNLQNEQRIQQKAKYLNYAYQKKVEGKKAICLGVYKHQSETIFVLEFGAINS
jgi:5-methylcytosine-specific restriction enzyme B